MLNFQALQAKTADREVEIKDEDLQCETDGLIQNM